MPCRCLPVAAGSFNDLSGIETILILQHAARAIQLAEGLSVQELEEKFLERLSHGKEQSSGDG